MTFLTIQQAGEQIESGRVSVSDLVGATIARIADTEPLLHAYAAVLDESARDTAGQLDQEIARGQRRGPLHGIPIALKDNIWTADCATSAGSAVLAGFTPDHDATVVAKLRGAGAVIMGKTVTHEFAYGRNLPATRNPWDTDRDPGSSSAGSGVAVAIGSAFGALGTDSAGSVRNPAAVNGIVGLKPTFGLVSRHGIVPMSPSLDTVGILARTVEDSALILEAIAGYDRRDPSCVNRPVTAYLSEIEAPAGRPLRVGVDRRYLVSPHVSAEVSSAIEESIAELRRLGISIVEVTIPDADAIVPVGQVILLADSSAWHWRLIREHGERYERATRVMVEVGACIPAMTYITAQRIRSVIRRNVKEMFMTHGLDAVLSATLPRTARSIDELVSYLASDEDSAVILGAIRQLFLANLVGAPAVSLPCGFSVDGLPIGMHLTGRPFDEVNLLRIARLYEDSAKWTTRRPDLGQAVSDQPAGTSSE